MKPPRLYTKIEEGNQHRVPFAGEARRQERWSRRRKP
jgi:hypothetical protein